MNGDLEPGLLALRNHAGQLAFIMPENAGLPLRVEVWLVDCCRTTAHATVGPHLDSADSQVIGTEPGRHAGAEEPLRLRERKQRGNADWETPTALGLTHGREGRSARRGVSAACDPHRSETFSGPFHEVGPTFRTNGRQVPMHVSLHQLEHRRFEQAAVQTAIRIPPQPSSGRFFRLVGEIELEETRGVDHAHVHRGLVDHTGKIGNSLIELPSRGCPVLLQLVFRVTAPHYPTLGPRLGRGEQLLDGRDVGRRVC